VGRGVGLGLLAGGPRVVVGLTPYELGLVASIRALLVGGVLGLRSLLLGGGLGVGTLLLGLATGVADQMIGLGPGGGLYVGGAALGGLHDRANLLGRGSSQRRGGPGGRGRLGLGRLGGLQLLDGSRQLGQVGIHFVGVIAPAGLREVRPLDLLALQLHVSLL